VKFYRTDGVSGVLEIEHEISMQSALVSIFSVRIDEIPSLGCNLKIIQQVKKVGDEHHGSLADPTVIKFK